MSLTTAHHRHRRYSQFHRVEYRTLLPSAPYGVASTLLVRRLSRKKGLPQGYWYTRGLVKPTMWS